MSFDRDAWFVDTYVKLQRQQIAVDLGDTTPGLFKGAMFTAAVSPNFSQSNPAYGSSPWNANEASGPGYTSGGVDMTVVSFAELGTAGKVGWKFNTVSWSSSTITADGLLIYAPSLSGRAFLFRWFGEEKFTEDGLFEIAFHTDGIFRQPLWSLYT